MAMDPPALKFPARPPLITPSASPPPVDGSRHVSHPPRMPDSVPPAKRQRLLSTPRRTFPDIPSHSSSRPQTPIDIDKEREASKLRLLDVWASLAERYTRRLDEDDIVDIHTGEITRDNGVLRNSRKYDFGDFATASGAGDEDSELEDEDDDEYDLDELDAFAETSSEPYDVDDQDDSELKAGGIAVPPVTPLNPADAEDLRQFLAAERQRKEICGSDVDEDEETYSLTRLEVDAETEEEGLTKELEDEEETSCAPEMRDEAENDDAGGEEEENPAELSDHGAALVGFSEDELDNWDIGEGSAVHPGSKEETDSGDSDIEIIEPPIIRIGRSPKTSTTNTPMPKKNIQLHHTHLTPRKVPQQLQTPPRSQSSTSLSAPPSEERFIDLSLDSPPASTSRTTSRTPQQLSSPTKYQRGSGVARPATQLPALQVRKGAFESPLRKLDLTQLSKGMPTRSSPLKTSFSFSESQEESSTLQEPTEHPRKQKAFILLTPRKVSNPSKTISASKLSKPPVDEAGSGNEDSECDESVNASASPKKRGHPKTQSQSSSKSQRSSSKDPPLHDKHDTKSRKARHTSANDDSDDPVNLPSLSLSHEHSIRHADDDSFVSASASTPSRGQKTTGSKETDSSIIRKRKRTLSGPQMGSPTRPVASEQPKDRRLQPRDTHNQASSSRSAVEGVSLLFSLSFNSYPADVRSKESVPAKRSSSRKRHSNQESQSGSSSESGSESSFTEKKRRHRRRSNSRSRGSAVPHYPYPPGVYGTPLHPVHPPYAPIPDPRAQFIITQAMQQLSALVGSPWPPPHSGDGSIPHTPSRRKSKRASSIAYMTPTHHPHPYPYVYDPNFSHATLPPDSESSGSESPEPSCSGRRKSLVKRSRSRGRRVSFKVEDEVQSPVDVSSSLLGNRPSKSSLKNAPGENERPPKSTKRKGKGKAKEEEEYSSDAPDSEIEVRGRSFVRGQTPGPSSSGAQKQER
ncbi:hypothetical protein NLJ89_g3169 [Agrocybe chaxingu]|uniref:Uncharacterized protein n=1 Tax=Agrocybe chaxingu TaxID=84603 RepID=A0A9W8K2Z1_9AGAR|nr:hypothetical protein NLJ89_g3169 [Agrocybe chaxingu]